MKNRTIGHTHKKKEPTPKYKNIIYMTHIHNISYSNSIAYQ